MNISYNDGSNSIEPYNAEKLAKEAMKPEFVSALVYEPGKLVKIGSTRYRVGTAGNLIRI